MPLRGHKGNREAQPFCLLHHLRELFLQPEHGLPRGLFRRPLQPAAPFHQHPAAPCLSKLALSAWTSLKLLHHPTACLMTPDESLLADTRRVAAGFGLEIAANDYIVTSDGQPHLLEVNHIPNVTRFPEIWEAYAEFVVAWLEQTGHDRPGATDAAG
jgi:hypothetical protein